ncbi:hypothetical protein McanMca71_007969 [Microsporum canis]
MLLLLQCEGRFLERPSSQVLPRELDFGLEKREDIPEECFPFCTPGACSASSCGVSESNLLEGVELASNMTDEDLIPRLLAKRNIFGPTQDGITQYLMDQSKKSSINTIGPEFIGIYEYPSYCLQTSFAAAPLTEDQYLAGTAKIRLTGCTALVVVSARDVYMCHFWEDLHYPRWWPDRTRPDFTFFPILNMIRGEGDTTYAVGPALDTSLFTGGNAYDRTWAFIMTPRGYLTHDDPNTAQYPLELEALKALLLSLIPEIGIIEYRYDAVYLNREDIGKSHRGIALFEYDRNADGLYHRDWRLWMEQTSYKASYFNIAVS